MPPSSCLLSCWSRDADVLGVGVGLETLFTLFIPSYYKPSLRRMFVGDAVRTHKHPSFTEETSLPPCRSCIDLILKPNSHQCPCGSCDLVVCRLKTFIELDEGFCSYFQNKSINSAQIPAGAVVKLIQSVRSLSAPI